MDIHLGNSRRSFSQLLISIPFTFISTQPGYLVPLVQSLLIPVEVGLVGNLGMPTATDSQNLQYCCYWQNWAASGGLVTV